MAFMPAALRSTITKQFDCWISRRSKLTVGGKRYSFVKMVYQPALWFSINDTVPCGALHFSSALLELVLVAPAALPVATVLAAALPICMSVVTQPDSRAAAATAVSVVTQLATRALLGKVNMRGPVIWLHIEKANGIYRL